MALSVVFIHINFYLPDNLDNWYIRLAVPYFFIVSGYFVARKIDRLSSEEDKRRILFKRSGHLFKQYAIWLLIFLPIGLSCYRLFTFKHFCQQYLYDIFVMGNTPYAWPLWFIYSMAIVLLLSAIFNKKYQQLILFIGFILVYLLNFICTSYPDIVEFQFFHECNNLIRSPLGGGYLCVFRYSFI